MTSWYHNKTRLRIEFWVNMGEPSLHMGNGWEGPYITLSICSQQKSRRTSSNNFTSENKDGTWKRALLKGKSSSKPSFLGFHVCFQGCTGVFFVHDFRDAAKRCNTCEFVMMSSQYWEISKCCHQWPQGPQGPVLARVIVKLKLNTLAFFIPFRRKLWYFLGKQVHLSICTHVHTYYMK